MSQGTASAPALHPIEQYGVDLYRVFSRAQGAVHVASCRETDHVDTLVRFYAAVAGRRMDEVDALLCDDVRFTIHGPGPWPVRGATGRAATLDGIARNFASFVSDGPTIERVAAQGDVVMVIAHETGRYAESHDRYEHRLVQEFTFRDGRMLDYRLFVIT